MAAHRANEDPVSTGDTVKHKQGFDEAQAWWRASDFRVAGADVSIEQALQWAFGVEYAQLTLPTNKPLTARTGVSQEYRMIQEAATLGTSIDRSSGRAKVAEDADLIAAELSRYATEGKSASLVARVAEHARSWTRPDWLEGLEPRLEPAAWTGGKTRQPKTKLLRAYYVDKTYPHPRNPARLITKRVKVEDRVTPVVWNIHPDEIVAAREDYTRWRSVLDWLLGRLVNARLSRIKLNEKLPPAKPWEWPMGSGAPD